MSLANKLLNNIGAKLEEEKYEKKTKEISKNNIIYEILQKKDHQLIFKFEKRNNKEVTIVGKFFIKEEEKKEILKMLKKKLACGGTINNEYIEIQGDFKKQIKEILIQESWKFK